MKHFKKYSAIIFTVIVIVVFAIYFYFNQDAFKQLLEIPFWVIILLILLKLLRIYNSGQFIKETIDVYSKKIPSKESFYIALLSSIGNFFGPYLGGASVRAVYLKQKYGFKYTDFASSLSGYYFITFISYSLIGLLALIVIQVQTGVMSWLMYLVFGGWFITTFVLAEVKSIEAIQKKFSNRLKVIGKLLAQMNKVIKGWRLIKDDKRLVLRLNKLTVYGFIISLFVSYVEFRAIGAHVAIAPLALYVTLTALSLLVSITPSAIGIREAIFIFSGSLLGLSTEQILQIALIDRGATFIVMGLSYLMIKSHGVYKTIRTKPSNQPPIDI